MLTIITPVYCTSTSDYLYERTKFFIKNSFVSENIKRIIVDFGSLDSIRDEFHSLSMEHEFEFHSLGLRGEPFSIGLCRNYGVTHSNTEFISFQDVDLYAPNSIYESILNRLSKVEEYNFIESIPCLYLDENFTKEYQESGDWAGFHENAYENYQLKTTNVQMYAPVTSMILVRRNYYMECGGNNHEFHGHGYEDFEVLNRLANRANKFVRSRDYYNHDYKYDSPHFCGYRTFFSLFGRQLMNERIFFVHFWHPHNAMPSYAKRNRDNKAIFDRLIRRFDKENHMPPALSGGASYYEGNTLILAPFNGKTAGALRVAIPFFGKCLYSKDMDFDNEEHFLSYVKSGDVKRVLFFNSYGNEHRLKLYKACLLNGIKTINFDRGGLPNTWFFDPNGFNYESNSYDVSNWKKVLSDSEREKIQEYILNVLTSDDTLEKNGSRIGLQNFKSKYDLHNKKVLFIPMQRPGDSVIRHFSDKIKSVDNFFDSVCLLAKNIKHEGWTVIVKQHPLEEATSIQENENIIVLRSTDHFYDAISASDAVMLINSGVGLYSLMGGKPTYNVGNAYYCHDGLSIKIDNPENFKQHINALCPPSQDKVEQFVHYLTNCFYSYGQAQYVEVINQKTKSKTTNATFIDFTNLKIPLDDGALHEINISRRCEPFKINSAYFDYYRSGITLRDEIEKYQKTISELQAKNSISVTKKEVVQVKGNSDNSSKEIANSISQINKTPAVSAKLNKLKRSPYRFFKDALMNILNKKSTVSEY